MKSGVHIGLMSAFLMIALATVLDSLQFFLAFVPAVGWVLEFFIGAFAFGTFGAWFFFLGIPIMSGKFGLLRSIIFGGAGVVELIPLLDALPAITLAVCTVIFLTNREYKELAAAQQAQEEAEAAAFARQMTATQRRMQVQAEQDRESGAA